MSFFENLAFIMGGEEQITPQFRAAFADFSPAPATSSIEPSAPPIAAAPPIAQADNQAQVVDLESLRGFGGLFGSFGQGYYGQGFTPPPEGVVTTGQPSASGLYGGNVTYSPTTSAYSNINPAAYLMDKKEGASRLNAAVQRAQYQDYLNRFAPIENYAVSAIQGRNTVDLPYDIARANQSVMNAGANLQGQQQRSMGRYGLQYSGPNIAQSNEITGGRVGAINQARMADEQRAMNMVASGGQG